MKIRSVEAEFFHADTNVLADAAFSRFSKFCERSCKDGEFVDWVAVSISRRALLHRVSDMRQATIDYEAPLVQWLTLPL